MDPRLSWLRSFVAVTEESSFRHAAERLHLSTSAVSRHVRLLEDTIGAELLHRTTRSVRPTERGRRLYAELAGPVAAVERALRREAPASVRIGYTGAAADEIVPQLAQRWRSEATLALTPASSSAQIDGLLADELDVGVMWEGPRSDRFDVVVLHTEAMHIALPADHPRAGDASVPLCELADVAWVMAVDSSDHVVRTAFVEHCESQGFSPRILDAATGNQAQLTLVAAGRGACLVPSRIVDTPRAGIAFSSLRGVTARYVAVTRAPARPVEHEVVALLVEVVADLRPATATVPQVLAG